MMGPNTKLMVKCTTPPSPLWRCRLRYSTVRHEQNEVQIPSVAVVNRIVNPVERALSRDPPGSGIQVSVTRCRSLTRSSRHPTDPARLLPQARGMRVRSPGRCGPLPESNKAQSERWEDVRSDAVRLIEESDFAGAAQRITNSGHGDAGGERDALLGLIQFHTENYADAADLYAAALETA